MQRLAFAPVSTMTDDTETPMKVLEDKYDNRRFRPRILRFHTTEDRAEALSPSVSYIPFNQIVRKEGNPTAYNPSIVVACAGKGLLSSLLAASNVSPGEKSAPPRQKFQINDVNNIYLFNAEVMGVQM